MKSINKFLKYKKMSSGFASKKAFNSKTIPTGVIFGGAFLFAFPVTQVDAQVVVTTPPGSPVVLNGTATFAVNVDGTGANEFVINNFSSVSSSFTTAYMEVNNFNNSPKFLGSSSSLYKLSSNVLVDAAANLVSSQPFAVLTSSQGALGNWLNDASTKYVGFSFQKSGQTHYGWLELQVVDANPGPNSVTILRWAYEATPNKGILTGSSVSLPVSLSAFHVDQVEKSAKVSWQTMQEQNNAGFEVERSLDAKKFKSLHFIEGQGNSSTMHNYDYIDEYLKEGQTYYYRLKQIDEDGRFVYSKVITLAIPLAKKASLIIAPNPIMEGKLVLDYLAIKNGSMRLEVFNLNGQSVLEKQLEVQAGTNNIQQDLSSLPSGSYFIKSTQGSQAVYNKLIIQ